mmetsp:Transcript_37237/g.79039  ORF Transcript_37237/g.79039 Transcript_37237/m.79039 type:complete len:321 (-) Transcript_37237:43-1005(-)
MMVDHELSSSFLSESERWPRDVQSEASLTFTVSTSPSGGAVSHLASGGGEVAQAVSHKSSGHVSHKSSGHVSHKSSSPGSASVHHTSSASKSSGQRGSHSPGWTPLEAIPDNPPDGEGLTSTAPSSTCSLSSENVRPSSASGSSVRPTLSRGEAARQELAPKEVRLASMNGNWKAFQEQYDRPPPPMPPPSPQVFSGKSPNITSGGRARLVGNSWSNLGASTASAEASAASGDHERTSSRSNNSDSTGGAVTQELILTAPPDGDLQTARCGWWLASCCSSGGGPAGILRPSNRREPLRDRNRDQDAEVTLEISADNCWTL